MMAVTSVRVTNRIGESTYSRCDAHMRGGDLVVRMLDDPREVVNVHQAGTWIVGCVIAESGLMLDSFRPSMADQKASAA